MLTTNMLKKNLLAAALITVLTGQTAMMTGASAQSVDGYYIGVGAGYSMPAKSDATIASVKDDIEFDDGFVGLVSLGVRPDDFWRAELELGYRGHDVETFGRRALRGDLAITSLMLNALVDFDAGEITPYAGAGIGFAHISANDVRLNPATLPAGTPAAVAATRIDGSKTAVAVQGILGVSVPVGDGVDVTGQYHYFAIPNVDYGNDLDADFNSHNFLLGFRIALDVPKPRAKPMQMATPAPEPAPEPEPEPVMVAEAEEVEEVMAEEEIILDPEFNIFFDWDRADITPEARQILESVSSVAAERNIPAIVLSGHTDTSGARDYNMELSRKRAVAAQNVLGGLGYNGRMVVQALGEADLLVPTGDGVREAQNRRVKITLE